MRHQDIGFDPNIVSGLNAPFSCRASENFLGQCHKSIKLVELLSNFNREEKFKQLNPGLLQLSIGGGLA
jgi:hypothetical protein